MTAPILQDLKYGIIYVCGNPKQTYNLRWFASMIGPMIRPLKLEWVETWEFDHTIIVARRFNIGNMGKYATVQLHLNKYGRSDSFSLLAAVHVFSDCLEDVMDTSEGDVIINEQDYSDRNELPQGKWGSSTSSVPFGDVLNDYHWDIEMRQDKTRVEESRCRFNLERAARPKALPEDEQVPETHLSRAAKSLRRKLKRAKDKISESECKIIIDDEELIGEELPCVLNEDDLTGDVYANDYEDSSENELLEVEVEEAIEFRRIESEYERDVKDLRARIVAFIAKYHQDPEQVMSTMLKGKVLLGQTPSRVLVNGDMKIVLPEYDEMEIEMPAMCRTLYILFMKYRKQGQGIVLRNMDEHSDEILDIYGLVKPGANEQLVKQTIDNLCYPGSESLNQTISRINRCIRNVITDRELAKQYIVSGERGKTYSINLAPDYLELPRAVTCA